jgi:hypothetical protein
MVKRKTHLCVVIAIVIVVLFSGCTSKNDIENKTEMAENSTITNNVPVMAAQLSVFIKSGDEKQVNYRNHDINIKYVTSVPQHIVELSVDTNNTKITISHDMICTGQHCQYHDVIDGIGYIIEPVSRNGTIWSSQTWDTEELYIEISTIYSSK